MLKSAKTLEGTDLEQGAVEEEHEEEDHVDCLVRVESVDANDAWQEERVVGVPLARVPIEEPKAKEILHQQYSLQQNHALSQSSVPYNHSIKCTPD